MPELTCPSCGSSRDKKELSLRRRSFGLGVEYDCPNCGSTVFYPASAQAMGVAGIAMIILANVFYSALATVAELAPTLAMGVGGAVMFFGFARNKPRV